jgi:Alpha-L-arabinofuranosidase B (ABFB) domain
MHKKLFKAALSGLLFAASLFSLHPASAAEQSFQSYNFPNRFVRHRDFLMYIEPATTALAINDSAFKVKYGLAGRCQSFESRNFPGHFIRHQNFRLKLSKFQNEILFREDATFCSRPGLASSSGVTFESFNLPGHFMRHQNFELRIAPSDGSDLFKRDATFFQHSAGVPFGDDNVGIGVEED